MNDIYSTTDLYLAVFLACKGYEGSTSKKNGGQCIFKFNNDENLESVVNSYYNNETVNVLDFKNKLRDKKSEIINLTKNLD
jgi:hypothetical protein